MKQKVFPTRASREEEEQQRQETLVKCHSDTAQLHSSFCACRTNKRKRYRHYFFTVKWSHGRQINYTGIRVTQNK